MKRTFAVIASLLVLLLPVKADFVSEMIPLVHPELVNENESWLENGYVVDWREFQTPTGITVSINEWNPKTGQIRLDQTSGQFSSNFEFYNSSSYPGAITEITVIPSSGKLKKGDLLMTAGSFPYTFEKEAREVDNGLAWSFDKKDDVREFRIEAVKPEQKNNEQVIVSFITVCYEGANGYGHGYNRGGKDQGDPIIEPEPNPEPGPNPTPPLSEEEMNIVIGWFTQAISISHKKPAPVDETIGETFRSKFLLDQLTEEELAYIRAKYGEDIEYACRNWSKDIPKIKRKESEECLKILGRTPYSDLMTFIQGFIENLMMGLADGADLWNSSLGDNSHSNYKDLPNHMPLLGEDYEEFMKNPTDAGWQEFTRKAKEKVPFFDVVIEYDLWDYIYLNLEVEGLD